LYLYFYVPPPAAGQSPAPPSSGSPVIFYAGEWGWRPLQQDAASSLAAAGRYVLGIDSPDYFNGIIPAQVMAAEFAQFRSILNERAGRPKDEPVILIGFATGAEIIPYMLNRIGAAGVRGAVLIAPDRTGASVFRVSIQLKMDSPPDETFDVQDEVHRLPPMPLVFMDGSLDGQSAAKSLAAAARGPHKYAPVVGGDRQFHEVREEFFGLLADAVRWIDTGAPGPAAPAASPPAAPAAAPPTPTPPGR